MAVALDMPLRPHPLAFVAFLALGTACAFDLQQRQRPAMARTKLRVLRLQVAPDSELYPVVQQVADTWSAALGVAVTVSADGDIPIVLVPEFATGCGAGPHARGCSFVKAEPSESWTEIEASLHPSIRYGVLLHEVGHHLRGEADHLPDVQHAVMSATRALSDTAVLPEDVAFICAGGRMDCWSSEAPL